MDDTTLSQVGGTAGLGVTFGEETLMPSTAPAAHRQHLKAARALLRSLLPEAGSDIKGSWLVRGPARCIRLRPATHRF